MTSTYNEPNDYVNEELEKLREFFRVISRLTVDHDIVEDTACVTADVLAIELAKVDHEWSRKIIVSKQ